MGVARVNRWPWIVSGLCLVLAALTGAVATYLWWLPCRGRMLVGTPVGPAFSDALLGSACIERMNEGTPFPLATEAALSAPGLLVLATATMVLVAVAWLVPVVTEQLKAARRIAAALPALVVLAVALLGIGIAYRLPGAEELGYPLDLLVHLPIVVALVALLTAPVRHRWRYLVASLALSSMGFLGLVAEYLVMVRWSEANWDAPPGSGYLSAAFLLLCGVAVLVMTAAGRRTQPTGPRVVLSDVGGLSATATEQVQQVDPIA